jgi:uncharacterized protein (TIGR03437 family)
MGSILGDPASPLASGNGAASSALASALPYDLTGVSVTIAGRAAQLIQVSARRVDFYVPANLPPGTQEVLVTSEDGYVSAGTIAVTSVAPALFAAGGNGSGAAFVLNAYTMAASTGFAVTTPENPGSDKRTRLALFATGLSSGLANATASNDINTGGVSLVNLAESVTVEAQTTDGKVFQLAVEYAGAEGNAAGLDQVVVVLPASLSGAGNVSLTMVAGSQRSNSVTVSIK